MAKNKQADALKADVQSVESVEADVCCVVRLKNTAERALHYISDVRATRYDAAARTLTLSLSDDGREVIPGAMAKLPEFKYIDPDSEAEITLRVPEKVVRLSRSGPPGKLAFETHWLNEADEVIVEVGWADVPYYADTRAKGKDTQLPAARWQQHKTVARKRVERSKQSKGD
ncbi:MAG: hypothetical protein CME36_20485 [unclassified Hahellaceae]|nr:hypothetical protein [Hahellaceae bacterium]|tara:strand:+ start:183999 stop:184514 length:516 start_codon:yes stop_codon:yes gene_type:complete